MRNCILSEEALRAWANHGPMAAMHDRFATVRGTLDSRTTQSRQSESATRKENALELQRTPSKGVCRIAQTWPCVEGEECENPCTYVLYLWHKASGTAYQTRERVLDPAPLDHKGKLWADGAGLGTLPLDSITIPPMVLGDAPRSFSYSGR